MMKLREDLVLRKIGDDYIMVDPAQGMVDLSTVHTLNETAAWLWEQLAGRNFTIDDVRDLLFDRYDITLKKAASEAQELIDSLNSSGLLKV